MGQNLNIINIVGKILNPFTNRGADSMDVPLLSDKNGANIAVEYRGKYATSNDRGYLFHATAPAITLPVIAATLVSKFAILNPVGSGVDLELIDCDIHNVLATTVVDSFALYESHGNNAATATLTTLGAPVSGRAGAVASNKGQFYSALTHVGTPVRVCSLGGHGAVTNTGTAIHFDFDGKVIVPEGTIVSIAASTAAGTASGLDVHASWLEIANR